ncbi:MAG: Asp23/Gls24 family envelope stress response protein [Clostridia bacterium]|nr:Asp23/Gls24 family envelope stress response protein [Clostridia bacterium]
MIVSKENETVQGIVKITDEVVAMHAAEAALRTQGVSSLYGGFAESIAKNFRGRDSLSKGVKLSRGEEGISVDIYVIVKYDAKIPTVAWELQRNIKNNLEEKTGEKVKEVNIHVQGVAFPNEEEKNDQK